MKKAAPKKAKLLAELTKLKMEEQKTGKTKESFSKFKKAKPRNVNGSNVGPSWGGRKGN